MHDHDYLDFTIDFASPATVSAYDELPLWSAMFGLLLLEEVPLAGARRVLDVGCGTGFPLIELAERLGPAAEVHGVDPWKAALGRAAEKLAVRRTRNVTLHEASATQMPFDDATFDLLVSNLGVNNFDDRRGAIGECRRVARDGAVLALTTNLQGHMRELYDLFDDVLAQHGTPAQRDALRAHVEHRATTDSVRTLVEEGGFRVTRVVERSAAMRFADGTALLHHYFIKLGFLDAWKTVVAGAEREIFPRLEERLNRHARERGAIALTIPMAYVESVAA
jgi:arsenite methyltransferase